MVMVVKEFDKGCIEFGFGYWGELSWILVLFKFQDKVEVVEVILVVLDSDIFGVENVVVSVMLYVVVVSCLFVCSQQQGEFDLIEYEKVVILVQLYYEKLLVFLECFCIGFCEEYLVCFGYVCGDYCVDFYCVEVVWQGIVWFCILCICLCNWCYVVL